MRLEPIDRPSSWLGRLMSFAMKRQLGKVILPSRVVYNRIPRMWNVSWALLNLEMRGLTIPWDLRLLIHTRASMMNGCTFCEDIAAAQAVQHGLGLERFRALDGWRESALFSDAERAALAYTEESTRKHAVEDATYEELEKHWSERQIAEITVVNAVANFYNLLNGPLQIPAEGLRALAEQRAR